MLFGEHPLTTAQQRQQVQDLCAKYKALSFAYSMLDLRGQGYHGLKGPLSLTLISDKTMFSRPHRHSALEIEIINRKMSELMAAGIIEPAPTSLYASAITVPAKKAPDGTWSDHRVCVDYRLCNDLLAPLHRNVPNADDLFQQLGQSKFFSKLDMRSGFFQLPLVESSKDLTSFWWGTNLYRYNRAPFGIKTCPAAFQAIMDTELQAAGLTHCTKCFIDDILVHSDTFEEHLQHLDAVLTMLHKCGLKAHPEKSLFCSDTMDFLGFDVSSYGLTPQEAKIKAMLEMPHPRNLDELRTVLGQLRYYGCFCPNFSALAKPMLDLLK